ncbi:hypothetical protein ACIA8G_41835 [Lentzea sp. NPDC051213]|uniref:hypothetical protein n=1 Tax=Lentzea sp. NPDC051213 TaxID=3364126 RepID=UPI0037B4243F
MEPVFEVWLIGRIHLIYPPSSATGPRPLPVQVSGHGVAIRVTAPDEAPVVVHSLAHRVEARHPTRVAPVSMDGMMAGVVIPDPHVRVWLDEPAQTAPGPVPLVLPTTVPGGQNEMFFLTAHTREHDVEWALGLEWSCDAEPRMASWKIRTTAESTMVRYHPDGTVTKNSNLHSEPDRPEIAAEAEAGYRTEAEGGDAEAMFQLGIKLAERGELAEARRWFQASEKSGHAKAAESAEWIRQRLSEK